MRLHRPTLALLALAATSALAQPAGEPNFECSTRHGAARTLQELTEAYERNDLLTFQSRLDPSLPGFQRFIDGAQQDFARQKQMRMHLKDVQLQCGPDVTAINVTWEKRFLEVTTFQPALLTGRMSVLLHRASGVWRLAAVGGDTPFGSSASGTAGELSVPLSVDISVLSTLAPQARAGRKAAASLLAFPIAVIDADQAGRGTVNVVVTTDRGDRETVGLAETLPGRFTRNDLPFTADASAPGDGALQVTTGTVITVRYADLTPGNNRPATVLTRTARTQGTPVVIDSMPDAFAFLPVSGAAPSTPVTSATIVVGGINTAVPISVAGGRYAINGGAFTAAPGTVRNADRVAVQVTSSAAPGGMAIATLTIGGVTAEFRVTNLAPDTTPDAFAFLSQNGVQPSTTVDSNPVVVTGINAPAPISIAGGAYSINGGAFTTAPGTVANGQSVAVRVTSSPQADGNGEANATLTIGGVTGTFVVRTWDTVPAAFGWPNALACPGVGPVDSVPVMITGLTGPAPVSIASGGGVPAANALYSVNGGPFTSGAGTVTNGQTVVVRVSRYGTVNPVQVRAIVTIGGVTGTWSTSC